MTSRKEGKGGKLFCCYNRALSLVKVGDRGGVGLKLSKFVDVIYAIVP